MVFNGKRRKRRNDFPMEGYRSIWKAGKEVKKEKSKTTPSN